jgi:ribonuclease H / adenosylcobalamin/alpha-ribazole phosphatase
MYKMYCDGASKGNPGPSGGGAVIKSPLGVVLVELSEPFGETTNNVAEYLALEMGLKKCKELNIKNLEVFMDSKLVVEQLSGRWKVKNKSLLNIHTRIKEITFEKITFNWIPRSENVHADQLANKSL